MPATARAQPAEDDRRCVAENVPVFLPPGVYKVSNLTLPDNTRITGVPGASRIVYTGDGHLFSAENARRIELSNIVIDGQNRWLGDDAGALVQFTGVDEVLIDNCEIRAAASMRCSWSAAAGGSSAAGSPAPGNPGIYAVESAGLSVTGNEVFDCGNGGILITAGRRRPTTASSAATGSTGSRPMTAAPARTATASTCFAPTT
jgi:hypothetical protein